MDWTLELRKTFQQDMLSIAFHPSGFHLLVGFRDKLRLMNILFDDIRTYKEYHKIRGCQECRFANGGHMFAVANNDKIHVYNTWNGQCLQVLRGHTQRVRSLYFTPDDSGLISAG